MERYYINTKDFGKFEIELIKNSVATVSHANGTRYLSDKDKGVSTVKNIAKAMGFSWKLLDSNKLNEALNI